MQPFGFLLTLLSDFSIVIASDNVADYLGADFSDVLQRPLPEVFSEAAAAAIRARVDYLSGPDAVERMFGLELQPGGNCSTLRSIFPAHIWSLKPSRA